MAAPDKETYLRVCSSVKPYFPVHEDHWERLNKTLGMLSSLDCRTVIRITSVRGVNMINYEGYREIVRKANPSLLEVKGFSISGNAPRISERLGKTDLGSKDPSLLKNALKYAPTHEEMLDFARKISDGFKIFPLINQSELNRQVLMGVSWKSDVKIDFPNEALIRIFVPWEASRIISLSRRVPAKIMQVASRTSGKKGSTISLSKLKRKLTPIPTTPDPRSA